MGFFEMESWGGLPFPSPGDLLDPGIEPAREVQPVDYQKRQKAKANLSPMGNIDQISPRKTLFFN